MFETRVRRVESAGRGGVQQRYIHARWGAKTTERPTGGRDWEVRDTVRLRRGVGSAQAKGCRRVARQTGLRGEAQSRVVEREQRRIDLERVRRPRVRLGVGSNRAEQSQRPQYGREKTLDCVAGPEAGQVDVLIEGFVGKGACQGWESGFRLARAACFFFSLVTSCVAIARHERVARRVDHIAAVEW